MSTRQNNVQILGIYIVFNKATNGQTDVKHEKEKKLSWMSLLKIAVDFLVDFQTHLCEGGSFYRL